MHSPMHSPREIVICGLDGVLALLEHRLHHLYNEEGVKQWDRFHAACVDDMPNLPLIERLNRARAEGVAVVLLSSRSARATRETEAWLRRWGIGFDALHLRPPRDYGPVDEYKAGIIEQHYAGSPIRRIYESAQHPAMARWALRENIPCTLVGNNQGDGASREQLELKVIHHACGHTTLQPFYGDDDFGWGERIAQLRQAPCPLCQADEHERERRDRAAEARLRANDRGLPPLEGSARQVEWAEGIRLNAFGAIDKVLRWMDEVNAQAEEEDPDHWSMVKGGIARAIDHLSEEVEAKWWIDHRHAIHNNLDGGRALLSAVAEEMGYM